MPQPSSSPAPTEPALRGAAAAHGRAGEPAVRGEPGLPTPLPRRRPGDGWVGAREFPGYRAGSVVARLDDLPEVYPDHLYFHVVLLDPDGRFQDHHSGPCYALSRCESPDERSRFVRVVAELIRHAPGEDGGLTAIGRALTYVRERGVEAERLRLAAQLLDDACSERAVVASLVDLLELTLGPEEAQRSMSDVVIDLARRVGLRGAAGGEPVTADFGNTVDRVNDGGLGAQVAFVAAAVGKANARRYLRKAIDFELLPLPHMLGL